MTSSDNTNICIYLADTGGGHRSAAEALKAGIELIAKTEVKDGPSLHVINQAVIEQSHPFNRLMVDLYNYLARSHPTWIKYFYNVVHMAHLESGVHLALCRKYAHSLLNAQHPTLAVSVHPLLAQSLALFLEELGLRPAVKLAIVVTDPNEKLWRAWACDSADLIIAPNNVAADRLVEWGVSADKIQVLGMPVHPKFLSPPSIARTSFLNNLGLDPTTFTLCINSGWAGNAHLLSLFQALKKCRRKLQVVFLSGYNRHLYERALLAAKHTGISAAVLPFYEAMADLMWSVDAMVTKAGGLTTYQALATRLPIIFDNTIEPMPQEAPTMQMLVSTGIAARLDHPHDITQIIEQMPIIYDRDKVLKKLPLPEDYQLNLTDHAIYDIARALLQLSNPHLKLTPAERPSVHYVA